jgi:hypothetical protein
MTRHLKRLLNIGGMLEGLRKVLPVGALARKHSHECNIKISICQASAPMAVVDNLPSE